MTSAESTHLVVRARHRRQAMDWSLVLLSQGIQSVVAQSESGWTLLVEPQDHARALATLRQYQLENRGWRWRQKMSWPQVTFHWGAVAWCLLLALFHWLNHVSGSHLKSVGVMEGSAVASGAWWRLFTATMLHFDLAHLMANVAIDFRCSGWRWAVTVPPARCWRPIWPASEEMLPVCFSTRTWLLVSALPAWSWVDSAF